jgi:4-amino-4-deoxy-L-arabinose transferase-like glycosyltransferase
MNLTQQPSAPSAPPVAAWRRAVPLLAILAFGAALRLWRLGLEGLWTDEMIAAYASNPAESLRRTYDVLHFWDQTPPLYPVLLWGWFKILGYTELNARLFSVLGGVLSLAAIHTLVRDHHRRGTALLVTWLAAVTPYHVYFSREVRSYIWALLLGTVVLITFLRQRRAYRTGATQWLFIGGTGLFLLASYFSFFVIAALLALLLLDRIRGAEGVHLGRWARDFALAALLYAPWVVPFARILGFHNAAGGSTPAPTYLLQVAEVFTGANAGGWAAAVLWGAVTAWWLHRGRQRAGATDGGRVTIDAAILFAVAFVLMYLKSIGGRNILNGFMYSYVIVLYPAFLLILAGLLDNLPTTVRHATTVSLMALMAMHPAEWRRLSYHKKLSEPYREMAAHVAASHARQAPILCAAPHIQEFYFQAAGLRGQLVAQRDLPRQVSVERTPQLWVLDSYDRQAEEMLRRLADRFVVTVLERHSFLGPTGAVPFQAVLVELRKSATGTPRA